MVSVAAVQEVHAVGKEIGPAKTSLHDSQTERSRLVQTNVRIEADVKLRAEEVLRLMGSSPTELVRAVYAKVAQGAQAYEETMAFLEGRELASGGEAEEQETLNPLLLEAWSIGRDYFLSVGINPDSLAIDNRSWEEMYHEGMEAHYREKGWMQ